MDFQLTKLSRCNSRLLEVKLKINIMKLENILKVDSVAKKLALIEEKIKNWNNATKLTDRQIHTDANSVDCNDFEEIIFDFAKASALKNLNEAKSKLILEIENL